MISLRTARVIVADSEDGNAFVSMLREIVAATPGSYDLPIGRAFIGFPVGAAKGAVHVAPTQRDAK